MKKSVILLVVLGLVGCTSNEDAVVPTVNNSKFPVVTIETSGDLYYEEGGNNIQMDFFGNCSPGQSVIYIEIDKKKAATPCKDNRYRYAMNLPKTFFDTKHAIKTRHPSTNYVVKEISAYHMGHKKLSATSYILIDRKRKEVRSVINKQVKFEKIPTGDYEPITQYNAFGSCTSGSSMKIDITSPDRFGHDTSKYDEVKQCQSSGGYYFLTQVHGYPKKGTRFKIHEDVMMAPSSDRTPASKDSKPKYKNLFNWDLDLLIDEEAVEPADTAE